jgi:hypothetical protein
VGENKYIDGYDIVTTIGAFYYLITPLFAFLFMQNEVVREKQLRLRQGIAVAIQDLTSLGPATSLTGPVGSQLPTFTPSWLRSPRGLPVRSSASASSQRLLST